MSQKIQSAQNHRVEQRVIELDSPVDKEQKDPKEASRGVSTRVPHSEEYRFDPRFSHRDSMED